MVSTLTFADSIAASPTTRLELNDGTTWSLLVDGTEFPPPPLDQAVVSTLLADGGVIPASKYGLRTLRLHLRLATSSADDTASQLQAFYRELDRPTNILRWQHATTNPVFFRTFRTSADMVDEFGPVDGTEKEITVPILAEPFAYGLLETPVSAVTVSTDPAAGSNGCFVDVTGVKGDVETPAIISFPGSAVGVGAQTMTAVRRRGTPANLPFFVQAEAMTQGTDTSTQPNDANFSGAGNNYSRTTFTTLPSLQTRLSVTTLGTSGVDLRGRYRVFLRYRKNTSTDAINLQLLWGDSLSTALITNDAYATPSSTSFRAADLGEISLPVGFDPVYDANGVELSVSNAVRFDLRAERTSGAGTIDFDFFVLVPADDRMAITEWVNAIETHVLDARDNSMHVRDGSNRVVSTAAPKIPGGYPLLSPGQTNRIFLIRNVVVWSLTTMASVSVSYQPRYLSVRPAST